MAKLPKAVVSGPHIFTVREAKDIRDKDDCCLLGDVNYNQMVIRIEQQLCISKKREALLHEITHSIFRTADIDRELGPEKTDSEIFRIVPLFLDVLRRNPKLVEYLMEKGDSGEEAMLRDLRVLGGQL